MHDKDKELIVDYMIDSCVINDDIRGSMDRIFSKRNEFKEKFYKRLLSNDIRHNNSTYEENLGSLRYMDGASRNYNYRRYKRSIMNKIKKTYKYLKK